MKKNIRLALILFALSFSGALLLALGLPAQAQPAKADRVGVVHLGGPFSSIVDGLRAGLKELKLEEGKQIVLEIQDTRGDLKSAEEAARKFEQEKAKLIYAVTAPVVTAARQVTKDIPIVFNVGSDPVAAGFVQSFVKPGGRLTGVHYLVRDLTAKRLEILKEILPKLRAVITFYDSGNHVSREAAQLGREEAKRQGIRLVERYVTSVEGLRSALNALKAGEADAYFYTADAMVISQAQLIIETAGAKKLPTMFHDRSLVARGALASYGQNYYEIGRRSAKYVQMVLSGSHPSDLKVDTVDNVELALNLKTAKQLRLSIPADVLQRASNVIR